MSETSMSSADVALRVAVDAMPIPAAIARDADTTLQHVNRRLANLAGAADPQVLVGRRGDALLHGSEPGDLFERLREGDPGSLVEATLSSDTQDAVTLTLAASPVTFQQQPCRLISGWDISELRRTQQRLRTLTELHERERRWVGLEIHDGLVQHLTGAKMLIESARNDADQKPLESLQSDLAQSVDWLERAIVDARALINGLRPPVLDQLGLRAALENLCEEMTVASSIEFQLASAAAPLPKLSPDLQTVCYRIAQEALNNARKHSNASRVELACGARDGMLELRVSDDGAGADDPATATRGVGLQGIVERAQLMGGDASIGQSRAGGWEVRATMPLNRD